MKAYGFDTDFDGSYPVSVFSLRVGFRTETSPFGAIEEFRNPSLDLGKVALFL
jgi:hypothetical protein